MRKLVWFSLGFGAACCLCAYVITGSTRVILAAAVGFLTLFAAIAGRKFALFRRIAAVLLGFAMGVGWFILYDGFYLNAAGTMDGKTANAVIRVSDYSYETAYGIGVDGMVQLEGKSYRLRAYLDLSETLEPGDTVSGQFRFRATTPKESRTYHAGNGIFLLAYQVDEVSVSPHAGASWRDIPARLRHRIQAILQTFIPQDAAPFARALLLGDTTGLSYAVDTSLKISGIRHVAAVSGLHVSILFALLTAITFRKRFLTALVGFPTLLLFAAVAGFTPSVSRSCIMCGLMLAALLLAVSFALSGCSLVKNIGGSSGAGTKTITRPAVESAELQFTHPAAGEPVAVFDTTAGVFRAVLFPEQAPQAYDNFVGLVQAGYYNGLTVTRVEQDFVVEAGQGADGKGTTIWNGSRYPAEATDKLHHYSGALCMAADSSGQCASVFYIMSTLPGGDSVTQELTDQMNSAGYRAEVVSAYQTAGGAPYLDYTDTVLGQVYEGMEVVDTIAQAAVDENQKPTETITINSVSIETYQAQ